MFRGQRVVDHVYTFQLKSNLGTRHCESVCFVVIVNRDCEMSWQSSFSARQEHHWSACGVGRVARGARSATLAVCILWLQLVEGEAKVCGQCGLRRAAGDKGVSKTSTSTAVTTDGTKQTGDTCGQRASLSRPASRPWRILWRLFQMEDHSNLLVCTCKRRFRKRIKRLPSPKRWQCAWLHAKAQ